MDLGFRRAPSKAPLLKPAKPLYADIEDTPVANNSASTPGGAGKTIRLVGAVTTSKRPHLRPTTEDAVVIATAEAPVATSPLLAEDITAAIEQAVAAGPVKDVQPASLAAVSPRPAARPAGLIASITPTQVQKAPPQQQEVVTRVSTSGGRHWGVNVGRFPSRYAAETVLVKTALSEISTLDGTLRKVVQRPQGYDANFLGMTRETADLACRRLAARNVSCFMIGPS
jgi:D-alanyl-D-alanine carboxypeptidase